MKQWTINAGVSGLALLALALGISKLGAAETGALPDHVIEVI